VFDFGDDWTHFGDRRIDPLEALGVLPATPLPFFGWGELPDQYGRRWDSDDGESPARLTRAPATYPHCDPGGDRTASTAADNPPGGIAAATSGR
jgi:hypothetical protein